MYVEFSFPIKKIYVTRQIRLSNLTIKKTKEMKLLESAKDLKTSCYIYFLIGNKS